MKGQGEVIRTLLFDRQRGVSKQEEWGKEEQEWVFDYFIFEIPKNPIVGKILEHRFTHQY